MDVPVRTAKNNGVDPVGTNVRSRIATGEPRQARNRVRGFRRQIRETPAAAGQIQLVDMVVGGPVHHRVNAIRTDIAHWFSDGRGRLQTVYALPPPMSRCKSGQRQKYVETVFCSFFLRFPFSFFHVWDVHPTVPSAIAGENSSKFSGAISSVPDDRCAQACRQPNRGRSEREPQRQK